MVGLKLAYIHLQILKSV